MSKIKLTFRFTVAFFTLIISCKEPTKILESNKNSNHYCIRYEKITSLDSALLLLKEGIKRFDSNSMISDDISIERRNILKTNGQYPFTFIISCSDS